MKVHIVSLYTLVYLLLGSKYKISICFAAGADDLAIQERPRISSSTIQLIPLELDNRVTTRQFRYQPNGENGNLFSAIGVNRFNKVTCDGELIWSASKNEYPDRVYYEIRGDKPLLQLIYSDEEFKPPQTAGAPAHTARSVQGDQVLKTVGGQEYVQLPLPKSGDERSVRTARAAPLKARAAPGKRAVPVFASHQTAAGQNYSECKMPRTDNEEADGHASIPKSVKVRASPVASSHALPASKGRDNYIQMPLPKSGTEGASIRPNKTTGDFCAPCVDRGSSYMQMPMPKTDNEGDNVSVSGAPGMRVVNAHAVHTQGKAAPARPGGFSVSHASPVRTGIEDGQSFLEYKMPRTDNEGAGGAAGQDFLEFKLLSSGPEHGKAAATATASGALPKRKAILSPQFKDYAMPKSGETGAESGEESEDFDIENDEEIQSLLRFIEEMKQKLANLRQLLKEMDERDALLAQGAGL